MAEEVEPQVRILCYHCKAASESKTCFAGDVPLSDNTKAKSSAKEYWKIVGEQVVKEKTRAQLVATLFSSKLVEIFKFLGKALVDIPINMENNKEMQFDLFAMPDTIRMCENCRCFFSINPACHCNECMGPEYRSHYVILMHGVVADPLCMAFIAQSLLEVYPQLFIYFPHKVAGKSLVGLELVVRTLSTEILDLFTKAPKQIKLSVIGHSFGGVILRHWYFFYSRKTPGIYNYNPVAKQEENAEGQDEKEAKAETVVPEKDREIPDIIWCNYMSVASPHAGSYENNKVFRKMVGMVGSKSIDELDNESVDLLLLASKEAMDYMKRFKNVVVYGNLSGDFLVAPRTSMLMPRHRVSGNMIKSFTKAGEKETGEPHSIWDMLAKYDGSQDVSDGASSSDEESNSNVVEKKEGVIAKLMEDFYVTVAQVIRKTEHVNKFMFNKDEPIKDGTDEEVIKQVFTEEDMEFFKMLFAQIESKASKKLLGRFMNSPKLLYNEVLLTALWDMAPNKFAVYLPTMTLPHRSILTPSEGNLFHKYTNKVLPHIASIFVT
ncbi:serine esterase domain containing protein [Babesia ovis]|uniref:Serine esterase domain containing protein n=1 Tax=Babesia ovis TaxID=5869 RepID=A0A9W5TCU3_BABOV|nr:serine esterase domain containing protein [Babesia ovis]